jgi:YjbE family integral membrane protein
MPGWEAGQVDAVIAWFATLDWTAIGQIILIDILLGGDNAVVIALACRNLPAKQRKLGIFWGAAGAIILRVILITFAVALLNVPALKLIGGALLIWIGVKLIAPPEEDAHAKIQASDKLWSAIKTIIVADLVMSFDNVIAIAGAAEQADPGHRTGLIIFGLLVSVPFIIYGSQLVLKLLDRFPIIVLAGGALLGWIAGGLMIGDALVRDYVPDDKLIYYGASAAGAVLVVAVAKWIARRRPGAAGGSAT